MREGTATSEDLLLIFRLNSENYGVWGCDVREVVDGSKVISIPKSTVFIPGIINRYGNILTIIDIAFLRGLPPHQIDRDSTILFLRYAHMNIGLLTKSLKAVKKTPTDLVRIQPDSSFSECENTYSKGIFQIDDVSVNLLDLEAIFKFLNEYTF